MPQAHKRVYEIFNATEDEPADDETVQEQPSEDMEKNSQDM